MSFKNDAQARANRLASSLDDAPRDAPVRTGPDPFEGRRNLRDACLIRVDRIVPDPDQPREQFDEERMTALVESLKARGQLQPIRVRWDEGRGVYVVVVGERRWRAAKLAGLESLAAVVVAGSPSNEEILEDQLVENALRDDLKPVEQARAFRRLMASLSLNQRQLAAKLNIGQSTVSEALALLDLPPAIAARVDDGAISRSAGYELSKVEPDRQAELAAAIEQGMAYGEVKARTVRAPKAKKARVQHKVKGGRVTIESDEGATAEARVAMLREAIRLEQSQAKGAA